MDDGIDRSILRTKAGNITINCQLDGNLMTVDIDIGLDVDIAALLWIRGG